MQRHTETHTTDGEAPASAARRVIGRFRFQRTGSRPNSTETDAKVHAAHVRPASYRAELF